MAKPVRIYVGEDTEGWLWKQHFGINIGQLIKMTDKMVALNVAKQWNDCLEIIRTTILRH